MFIQRLSPVHARSSRNSDSSCQLWTAQGLQMSTIVVLCDVLSASQVSPVAVDNLRSW